MRRHGTNTFNEALNRGLEFERGEAIDILHAQFPNHYIMNNQIDPSITTDNKVVGPRLYRGVEREEEYLAPDFVMFDETGKATWIDAKLKGAAYLYKGCRYFSVDRKKHESYNKFPQHMKDNFYFLFKWEKTGDIYLGKFEENPTTIFFDNKHDKGDVPIYFLEKLQKLTICDDK